MSVGSECLLGAALLAAAAGIALTAPFASLDRELWVCLLVVFSLPQAAAVGIALLAACRPVAGRHLPLLGGVSRAERF
jgi:hypothetical protein